MVSCAPIWKLIGTVLHSESIVQLADFTLPLLITGIFPIQVSYKGEQAASIPTQDAQLCS